MQSHILITKNLEKKLLNEEYYNKIYIRSKLLNHKKISLSDNSYSFSVFDNTTLNLDALDTSPFLGSSLNSGNYTYTNVSNLALKFKKNNCSFIGSNSTFLASFYNSLYNINSSQNKYKNLFILNPVKGGFNCYTLGLFGFLPRSHANKLFYELVLNILREYNFSSCLTFFSFFRTNILRSNLFVFRFSLALGNVSLYPCYKRNNFSILKTSVSKKKCFNNSLNLVFLSQFAKNDIK